jgi:hypothetical protein
MNPRTLLFVMPAVFVASLGLGYGFAPRAKNSAPTSGAAPASPSREDIRTDAATPQSAALNDNTPTADAAQMAQASDRKGTVEDVFKALASYFWCECGYNVKEAVSRLDVPELQSILDQIDSIGPSQQFSILPRTIDRLMDLDPQRALNWIETNAPTFREGSNTFLLSFELAYKKDPEGARHLYERMADGDRRNAIGAIVVRHMAMKDPAAASAFLEAIPKGTARDKAALGYVAGLATSNPNAAITEALKWKDGVNRRETLATAFQTLARGGQGQALAALDQISDERERTLILGKLTAGARESDLPALAGYYQNIVRDHPEVAELFNGVERLAEGFARSNPAQALEWAKELPDDDERKDARTTALSIWGSEKPEEAIAWAQTHSGDNDERQANLETVYRSWLKTDLPKAEAWAEKLASGPERDRHIGLAASQLATEGQHTKALELLQRLPAGQQSELAVQVAGSLVWENPPAASRWLSSIEPDENSATLFSRVAAEWSAKDFKAAANWIGTIPAGECRDHAIWGYAYKVARLDPAAAAEWAASTSNEESRVGMLGNIIAAWRERDLTSADGWLESTTAISADRKAALKEAFNARPKLK